MNNQRQPTTLILVAFAINGQVRAQATIDVPYLIPINAGDTIAIGDEFANVDSIKFAPLQHRLTFYCNWVYDPTEVENLADALEDAAAEGWTVERY